MALIRKDAQKSQAKLRMSLIGGPGAGKTRSALEIGKHFGDGRIDVLDTEPGSSQKYAGKVKFKVTEIGSGYHPDVLDEWLTMVENDCDVAVVDNLTHFWSGPGGLLELAEDEVKRQKARGGKGDSFASWKVIDPLYKRMVHRLMTAKCHLIVCVRAKVEHVRETDDRGKTTVRKVGMAPEMRDQFVFVNDIEGMLDQDHNLVIGKTRCDEIDGKVFPKPGKEFAEILKAWLSDGAPASVVAIPELPVTPPPGLDSSAAHYAAINDRISTITADAEYQDARAALREAIDSGKVTKTQGNELAKALVAKRDSLNGAAKQEQQA